MIREFLSRRRLIFFPKSWANSVSQWICGVHSPSGTLKIVNTANPSKGKSASFDVDIDAVWNRLRDRIDAIRREDDDQKLRDSKDETFGDKLQNGSSEDLTHDDITDWDDATAGFLTDDDYDTISGAITDLSDIVDEILTELDGYLTVDDIGVTVAEEDHTHTTADISDWGTATADFLTDADMSAYALDADLELLESDVDDISETLETIIDDIYDDSGNLSFVTTDTAQNITARKDVFEDLRFFNQNISQGSGSKIRYVEAYAAGSKRVGALAFWGDRTRIFSQRDSIYSVLDVGFNNNGNAVVSIGNSPPSETSNYYSATNLATCEWVINAAKAKDGTYSSPGQAFPGGLTANPVTWTSGGTNGWNMGMTTRVCYDKATHALWGFYREMRYDKYGRLYSVGAEVRYNIDTATLISWI